MSRLVVADTGPLIHLAQADILPLLELTGNILVPRTALTELEEGSIDVSDLEFAVVQAEFDPRATYPHLEAGETAAIVLCTEHDAVLLTDDLDARNTAREEGIEVHGSVGVVLYAYSKGGTLPGHRKTCSSGAETRHEPIPLDTTSRARNRVGRVRRCRMVAPAS